MLAHRTDNVYQVTKLPISLSDKEESSFFGRSRGTCLPAGLRQV